MPVIKKRTRRTARKTATSKPKRTSKAKKTTRARNTKGVSRGRPSRPRRLESERTPSQHKTVEEATFVYECTRAGCGYRIWREEKDEAGHLRFDLKCPKCHHKVFRCLGKGDLPETFEAPLPAIDEPQLVDANSLGVDSD